MSSGTWSVTQDAFEVSLNFSRKPERLIVPFDSITGFTDPSVPFGFKLEPRVPEPAAGRAPALVGMQESPPPAPAGKDRAGKAARPRPAGGEVQLAGGEARRRPPAKPRSCRSTPSARNSRGAA